MVTPTNRVHNCTVALSKCAGKSINLCDINWMQLNGALIRRMPTTNVWHSKWKVILPQGTISIESKHLLALPIRNHHASPVTNIYSYNVRKYETSEMQCIPDTNHPLLLFICHIFIIRELLIFESKRTRWKTIEKCSMHTSSDFLFSSDI